MERGVIDMLKIKRVYDDESQQDGKRYLVDGVWPRGVKKEDLDHVEWYKELSPSTDLRKWLNHDAGKWEEFRKKYFSELDEHKDLLKKIKKDSNGYNVTLLYSAKNEEYNQAVAIRAYIEELK